MIMLKLILNIATFLSNCGHHVVLYVGLTYYQAGR